MDEQVDPNGLRRDIGHVSDQDRESARQYFDGSSGFMIVKFDNPFLAEIPFMIDAAIQRMNDAKDRLATATARHDRLLRILQSVAA